MTHVGQEFALCLTRGFGRFLGFFQGGFCALALCSGAQGDDSERQVVRQFLQLVGFLRVKGIGFARVDGERTEGLPIGPQGKSNNGCITASDCFLAPGTEGWIGPDVPG